MSLSALLSSPLLSSPSPPPHSLSQLDSAPALGLYYFPFRGPAETDHCLCTIPFPGRESDWPSLRQLSTPRVLSYDWACGAATGDRTAQGPYLWILGGGQIPRTGMAEPSHQEVLTPTRMPHLETIRTHIPVLRIEQPPPVCWPWDNNAGSWTPISLFSLYIMSCCVSGI